MKKIVSENSSYIKPEWNVRASKVGRSSYLGDIRREHVRPMAKMERPFPEEKKVIPSLPQDAPERAMQFAKVFNQEFQHIETEGLTFTKFHLSSLDDGSFNMEWIENYFRVYFAFEKDENDTWGMVVNDTEHEDFLSTFHRLKKEEFASAARESIEFVISHKKR